MGHTVKYDGPWFTTQLTLSATIGICSILIFSYCRTRWPLLFAPRTKLKGTQHAYSATRAEAVFLTCSVLSSCGTCSQHLLWLDYTHSSDIRVYGLADRRSRCCRGMPRDMSLYLASYSLFTLLSSYSTSTRWRSPFSRSALCSLSLS